MLVHQRYLPRVQVLPVIVFLAVTCLCVVATNREIPGVVGETEGPVHITSSQAIEFKAVDARGWGLSASENYLLSSLEGLVNREVSDLFVIDTDDTYQWLQSVNVTPYSVEWLNAANLQDLVSNYSSHIDGMIIWDDLPESGNIGTPLSGIYNCVMVHKDLYPVVSTWVGIQGKPVVENLTEEYAIQGFNSSSSRASIYQWAFDTFFSLCNQTALGMFNSANPANIRSQLCGNGIFTFWQPMFCEGEPLPPDPLEDVVTFEYILNNSPQNIVVYGYMAPYGCNEHPVVRRLSENGKFLVPSDWFNHMPFWQNLPLPPGFRFNQEASRNITSIPLENKVYVAGIYSDGDNIQYVGNFMKSELWDGKHGDVPTTYEMTPSIVNMAPAMAMVYYREMTTNDYFVNGVGGKGYVKSDYAPPAYFKNFWEDTRDLMERLDQREARTWNSGDTGTIVELLTHPNGTLQVDSIIEGYGGGIYVEPVKVNGIPFTYMMGYSAGDSSEYRALQESIVDLLHFSSMVNQPAFVTLHIHCWSSPYDVWSQFVNETESLGGGRIEFVTSGQLSRLMLKAKFPTPKGMPFNVGFWLAIAFSAMAFSASAWFSTTIATGKTREKSI
ncbi:MAG: hypothetical protein ACTSU9_16215 [Promethearchaeota archaeon]